MIACNACQLLATNLPVCHSPLLSYLPDHLIDIDPSYLDHLGMIKIRRIKIDINGPEDSPLRGGQGVVCIGFYNTFFTSTYLC